MPRLDGLIDSGIMMLSVLSLCFATTPVLGQANPQGEMLKTFGLMAFMALFFYLILIRPQQKRAKQHAELLKTLKAGDKVLTNGGIVGVVVSVKDKTVSLRSADTKLEILKSAVTEISERNGAGSES